MYNQLITENDKLISEYLNDKFEQTDDFSLTLKKPVLVKVKEKMFEDDFVEVGMVGLLHKLSFDFEFESNGFILCLHIDFSKHTEHNKPLLQEVYYANNHTAKLKLQKELYTAADAGYFSESAQQHYSVFVGDFCFSSKNVIDILEEYLEIV